MTHKMPSVRKMVKAFEHNRGPFSSCEVTTGFFDRIEDIYTEHEEAYPGYHEEYWYTTVCKFLARGWITKDEIFTRYIMAGLHREPTEPPKLELTGDCARGFHIWVDEVGRLPSDTSCAHCGERYGDPQ